MHQNVQGALCPSWTKKQFAYPWDRPLLWISALNWNELQNLFSSFWMLKNLSFLIHFPSEIKKSMTLGQELNTTNALPRFKYKLNSVKIDIPEPQYSRVSNKLHKIMWITASYKIAAITDFGIIWTFFAVTNLLESTTKSVIIPTEYNSS